MRQQHLVATVEVDIGEFGRLDGPGGRVRQVLRGDQVLERREPHVADVDAAKEPVPVAVVRLPAVQVICRRLAQPPRHRRDLGRRPQHLLVEVVDLAVLHLEVAPEPATQPARLRPVLGDRVVDHLGEDCGFVGGECPFAHLGIRARRDIDATDRRVAVEPVRRRHRGQPVGVRLQRVEEPIDPAAAAPAVLPRRGPRTELLAVVAHGPEPAAVGRRVITQVADHIVHLAERNPVAQSLLRTEHGQEVPLVLGRVRAPEIRLGNSRGAEMRVVEDRPLVARPGQRCRQVGLPHPLGEPRTARPRPRQSLDLGSRRGLCGSPGVRRSTVLRRDGRHRCSDRLCRRRLAIDRFFEFAH